MEQLSSIDASFIQAESPNLPMHITTVSVYDPSTAPQGPVRFKDIMKLYEEAIFEVPLLRRRLVEVPGNMDFPYWIEDPDFDIEFHVRHIALPQPGDWRQLYIQLARLHSRALDMSRPLWEVYIIEALNHVDGIPKGSFAIAQKLHHAAMDGASVRKMFTALHTLSAEAPTFRHEGDRSLVRENRPGSLPLLLRSYQRSVGRPAKLGKAVLKTIQSSRKLSQAQKAGELDAPAESPKSRFNSEVSPHRVVTTANFDFDDFQTMRKAVPGATVNDLAVSIIGGALRHYLQSKDEDVSQSLVVQIPVDIRTTEQQAEDGNKITTINAACGSGIESPLERLESVRRSTAAAKKRLEVMGPSMTKDMADAMGPHVTKTIFSVMESASKYDFIGNLMPGGPNFALSNMPGPPIPMYLCGAELVWGIGLGPMMPGMGLFVTVTSTLDRFTYGITACREMMPDPEFFQQCLYDSYAETKAELGKALKKEAAKKKPKAKRKTRKKS